MTDAVLILSQFFWRKKGQPNNELKNRPCLQVLSPFFVEWKSERKKWWLSKSATKEWTKVANFWQNALSWCFWAHRKSLNQRERKSISWQYLIFWWNMTWFLHYNTITAIYCQSHHSSASDRPYLGFRKVYSTPFARSKEKLNAKNHAEQTEEQ